MARGDKYEGNPCIKCGKTLRYVYQRECVACANKRAATGYAAHREERLAANMTPEQRERKRKRARVRYHEINIGLEGWCTDAATQLG